MRPSEVDVLLGDPSKAMDILGWKRKVDFDQMIDRMVKNDISINNRKK